MDWSTAASLATAAGTLVLAMATFAAIRSANASARVTERALLAGIRPVIVTSRMTDEYVKVGFIDDHWLRVEGGRAAIDVDDHGVYLAISLRNVGNGLAVLDRWDLQGGLPNAAGHHRDLDLYRRLTRDIYVPAGDIGFWQGAFRPDDERYEEVKALVLARDMIVVDLLYGDHEGGQRTITRIALRPIPDDGWLTTVSRHWNLDRTDPR